MATSMAAAIKDKLGITAELVEGHGVMFEVAINGEVLPRKCACRPFSTAAEVIGRAQVLMKTRNRSNDARRLDRARTPSGPSSSNSCCGQDGLSM